MHAKKTKIVATIGPVSANEKTMGEMIKAGLNVIRINFSHGDFAEHEPKVRLARELSLKYNRPIAVMQDLSGPKFRIGDFDQERVMLEEGKEIILTPEQIVGTPERVSINYPNLAKEVKVGGVIMLDDGRKRLDIIEINGEEVKCRIAIGGETKGRRSVNLPGAKLSIGSLTEKDKKDLEFAFEHDVDIIAFSFVRRADDVRELREILKNRGSEAMIVAKIETQEAVENFDSILAESDGIMVARGDLAVEIPAEDVPLVQKMIIKKCNQAGKPVITATQMLESMVTSSVPTRAEVSDIANAILDGTDAIMLSEETTLGKYPVEVVKVMSRVAVRVERDRLYSHLDHSFLHDNSVTDAVGHAVTEAASQLGAKYIVALTNSGFTARMIARYRPHQPIMALTPSQKTINKLALSYGCFSAEVPRFQQTCEIMDTVRAYTLEHKLAKAGDRVLIAAGMPFGESMQTNTMMIEVI
jgi:pyruvate kinase